MKTKSGFGTKLKKIRTGVHKVKMAYLLRFVSKFQNISLLSLHHLIWSMEA